jgi:hypothetical protein
MKRQLLLIAALLVLVAGCASVSRHPVPEKLVSQAEVPGLPGVRTLAGTSGISVEWVDRSLGNAVARASSHSQPLTMLAISGGGPHGAYGAGVLCGWTRAGNRPEFDIITGISTGSLIGPYAFLGPAYDAKLKQAYTTITDKDIFKKRGFFKILFGADSVASSAPLAKMIAQQIDPAMLEAIAAEHRKGRRFYVGTSDLDAQSLMVWDMGAIAASGRPDAQKLFCEVLLASASIPVAFPPVLFQVEADGKSYDEMHADGGVMTQVFGALFLDRLRNLAGGREGRFYLIRNERIAADWEAIKPSLIPIASRTVATMIKTQGFGDIYRNYFVIRAGQMDFNLASIPESFEHEKKGEFDPAFMQALFELGYDQARNGSAWVKVPPGYGALDH